MTRRWTAVLALVAGCDGTEGSVLPRWLQDEIVGPGAQAWVDVAPDGTGVVLARDGDTLWTAELGVGGVWTVPRTIFEDLGPAEVDGQGSTRILAVSGGRAATFLTRYVPEDLKREDWVIRHDPATGWGAPVLVQARFAFPDTRVDAALEDTGRVTLMAADREGIVVRAQPLNVPWGPAVVFPGERTADPHLVVAPDGTLHAAWTAQDEDGRHVLVSHRDPAEVWTTPERVPGANDDATDGPDTVAFAVGGDGALFAAWSDGDAAYVSRRGADGWAAPLALAVGGRPDDAAIVADDAGRAVVAWARVGGGLYAGTFDPADGWSDLDHRAGDVARVDLEGTPDGDVLLTWSLEEQVEIGDLPSLWARAGDSDGAWERPFQLRRPDPDAWGTASAGLDAVGRGLLVWTGSACPTDTEQCLDPNRLVHAARWDR